MNVQYKQTAHDLMEAKALCDDPASFFGSSQTAMHSIERDRLDKLQTAALCYRFDELRNQIPMLRKLADKLGIEQIRTIDDVVPLLFEHTMYKSYPASLLDKHKFTEINRWLSRLTTYDLTETDVSACHSIDEWFEVMDRNSPLKIVHSSDTSGLMSFVPTSKAEWDKCGRMHRADILRPFGGDDQETGPDEEIWAIYPFFRYGGSAHIRINDNLVKYITGREERLLTAYPGRMSSDVLHLAGRIRAAQTRGDLDKLDIAPELIERKADYEKLQAEMPGHMQRFFKDAVERLRGKRVVIVATWNLLHNMAKAGLAQGLDHVFAPNSAVLSGGGAKGMDQPADWMDDVARFVGAPVRMNYGMSEMHGVNVMCQHSNYHFPPWIIPILLDPDTGEVLPRTGVVTGRVAYFDLSAETRWGGFITGDEITVDWDGHCACGRSSHHIVGAIQRYSEMRGGDDKISCAATENAHKEAMDFLTTIR